MVRFLAEARDRSRLRNEQTYASPILYTVDTGGFFFPGAKRSEREADHSHPSSAEVETEWR